MVWKRFTTCSMKFWGIPLHLCHLRCSTNWLNTRVRCFLTYYSFIINVWLFKCYTFILKSQTILFNWEEEWELGVFQGWNPNLSWHVAFGGKRVITGSAFPHVVTHWVSDETQSIGGLVEVGAMDPTHFPPMKSLQWSSQNIGIPLMLRWMRKPMRLEFLVRLPSAPLASCTSRAANELSPLCWVELQHVETRERKPSPCGLISAIRSGCRPSVWGACPKQEIQLYPSTWDHLMPQRSNG